jgi:cytochrome c-type biogenesis protein CcmH/NrfG
MKTFILALAFLLAAPAAVHAQAADTTHHDSVSAKRWVAKGDAAMAAGQSDSARAAYERALMYDGDDVDAVVKMATILVNEGHGKYAGELLTFELRRHPDDPRLTHFRVVRSGADTAGAMSTGP